MDLFHSFLKTLDHWRGTALSLGLAAALVCLAACETLGHDPTTGNQASLTVISNNVDRKAIELEAAAAEADRLYAASLSTLKHDYEKSLSQLASVHTEKLSSIQVELEALTAGYEAAVEEIETKAAKRAALISIGQDLLNTVHPGLGGALAASGLLTALGVGYDNRRKDKTIKRLKDKK